MVTLKTDWVDGDYVYAKTTADDDGFNGITNEINAGAGLLGEIRQIALSLTGSLSKATLQGYGWAICDGTTPAAQGISDATITTTPDLRLRFLRHSANETTGGNVTQDFLPTHKHSLGYVASGADGKYVLGSNGGSANNQAIANASAGTAWLGYDICYFMKVK